MSERMTDGKAAGLRGATASPQQPSPARWKELLAPYQRRSALPGVWQLISTAVPFAALWLAMWWSLSIGYWLTLLLAIPTGALLIRLFMFQHDCGHGSFFPSQRLSNLVGGLIGVLTLVPYNYWRKTHAVHHATSGNLDLRSFGDIDTLTVREYLSLSKGKRLSYRLYRNPVIMLLLGPLWQFVVKHRWPTDLPRDWKREWASVHRTNLGLMALVVTTGMLIGFGNLLLIQAPIVAVSGALGVFLFYVQHQYEDSYWHYREEWDYFEAGLHGSSHLVLPRPLRWLTASIGLHHVHHINSRIPNYELQRCHDEVPVLQSATELTLGGALRTLRLSLWDEESRRLIGFRDLKRLPERLLSSGEGPTRPEAVPRAWR